MEEVVGLWDSHVGGVSTGMQVWGQEGTRGWAEKVAGPGHGELEQGLQPAANWCDPASTAGRVLCSSKGVINAGEI